MYDYYGKPPQTREDVREWLTSWLRAPDTEQAVLQLGNETFIQESGFRVGRTIQCVMKNTETSEYAWWSFDSEDFDNNLKSFPKERYPTFESLLNAEVESYVKRWNLCDA